MTSARSDVPEGRERDALVLDDLLERGVDDRGDDVGDTPDAVGAVLALDDLGRLVLRGGEEGVDERGVEAGGLLLGEAEVAALVLRVAGRHGACDVLPLLAALEVLERLLGLGLGGVLLGLGGLGRTVADLGLDLDGPRVAELRGGRLLGELRVDIGVGDGHAFLSRELRLDVGVDQPFEDERVQVLLLLAEERQLRLGIVVADRPLSATGADGPLLELDPEGVDLGALDVGVLADGLPIDGRGGREMVVEPARSAALTSRRMATTTTIVKPRFIRALRRSPRSLSVRRRTPDGRARKVICSGTPVIDAPVAGHDEPGALVRGGMVAHAPGKPLDGGPVRPTPPRSRSSPTERLIAGIRGHHARHGGPGRPAVPIPGP